MKKNLSSFFFGDVSLCWVTNDDVASHCVENCRSWFLKEKINTTRRCFERNFLRIARQIKLAMTEHCNVFNSLNLSSAFSSSHLSRAFIWQRFLFMLRSKANMLSERKNQTQIIFQFKLHKIFTQDHIEFGWAKKGRRCDKNQHSIFFHDSSDGIEMCMCLSLLS